MSTREVTTTIPVITVDRESGSSIIKTATVVECQVTSETTFANKTPAPRPVFGRIVQLRSHLSPLSFLPPQLFVYTCICLLFSITFISFYLSLTTVTNHEKSIREIEISLDDVTPDFTSGKYDLKMSRESADKLALLKSEKSKYLTLVVVSLVSLPFHVFGLVAVTKRSFTLTLTYSLISFILLCLQLKTNLSLEGYYLTLWSFELVFFTLASPLYCIRLYYEKIRNT